MSEEREARFKKIAAEFPDSPMSHFTLGKLYLDARRYQEAVRSLEEAMRLDPHYAAAGVALGEAYAGAGDPAKARGAFEQARKSALAQKHDGLAEEIGQKIAEL